MDKRRDLRIRIQNLLDECGDCPKRGMRCSACKGCDLFARIRSEGDKLIRTNRKRYTHLEITVPEYWQYHNSDMTDGDIADLKKVDVTTLLYWKRRAGVHAISTERRLAFPLTTEKYKKLRASGWTIEKIQKRYGIARSSFFRWKKENNLPAEKEITSDEQIIKAAKAGKGIYYMQTKLHVSSSRVYQVLKNAGIRLKKKQTVTKKE